MHLFLAFGAPPTVALGTTILTLSHFRFLESKGVSNVLFNAQKLHSGKQHKRIENISEVTKIEYYMIENEYFTHS